MGQRSQIYIRFHDKSGTQLIARYFQWNFSERMISRARGLVEELDYVKKYSWILNDKSFIEKLTRICDVNFDMRDIVLSHDILKDIRDYFFEEARTNGVNGYIFGQDNNNGQLFIDVVIEGKPNEVLAIPSVVIKYAFLDYYLHPDKPLDAEGYMEMDTGKDWKTSNFTSDENEQDEASREIVKYTMDNIEYINKNATLMTTEELEDFINDDYEKLVEEK